MVSMDGIDNLVTDQKSKYDVGRSVTKTRLLLIDMGMNRDLVPRFV